MPCDTQVCCGAQIFSHLDEFVPDGVTNDTNRVVNAELLHDAAAMAGGGLEADAQLPGDLFGRQPFGDQAEHDCFAGGQAVQRLCCGCWVGNRSPY